MGKDYYNTLGVDKSASQDDIKKAFRKLAHQHHPDKAGGDESKFKDINEAYQVLGDAEKRKRYDQFGSAFEHGQANGAGSQGFDGFSGFNQGFEFNMDDLGDMFGGLGDMFGFGGQRRKSGNRPNRGNDIHVMLILEFMEAVFGIEKEISLNKTVVCGHCNGNGAEPGSKIETCKTCGGTGHVAKVQRTIFGQMQVQMTCTECAGEGKIYSKKCGKCSGKGLVRDHVKLKIKIPAGINTGETIRVAGQGEAGEKGGNAGDLLIEMRINPDKNFRREGYNIYTKSEISFTQAALGDIVEVKTVNGPIKLKIPEGTQSSNIFKLREQGVPYLQGRGKGDHFVEVIVKTPKNLSRKQKDLLRQVGV